MRAKRVAIAAAALVLVAVVGGIASAAIPGSGGVINGCYEKRTGILRVIDAEAGKRCLSFETPISWNEKGEKGDKGDAGPAGPKGDTGPAGPAGPAGPVSLSALENTACTTAGGSQGTVDVTIARDGTVGLRCTANTTVNDPIPDPIAAGWTKEGGEPHVPAGTSLRMNDTTNAGFVRFFVEDPAAFGGEIELNPSVSLDPGFSVDGEGSTGVHVAINDSDRQIRADVLGVDGGGVRVALKLLTGYTTGFVLPTPQAAFQLKRLADGSAVLAVAGQPPETVPRLQLALSPRPGQQTLEFGADSRSGVVTAEWFTLLGLPPLPR